MIEETFDEEIGASQGPTIPTAAAAASTPDGSTELFVFQGEKLRDPPTEADELAKKWLKRIEAAKKHWQKFYDRCRHNRTIVDNLDWTAEPDGDAFCPKRANLIGAAIASILPNIYAKNPEISVTPVRRSDADAGRLAKTTETIETVLNRYLTQAGLKTRARAAVRAALTCSYGVVKVVYQKDIEQDPIVRQRLQDAQDNLQHIDGLLSRIADGDQGYEQLKEEREELLQTIEGLKADVEAKQLDGLVIDRILTDQLIIDPTIIDFEDYPQADWMCQIVPMRRSAAEELYKWKLPRATAYEVSLDKALERGSHQGTSIGSAGSRPEEDDTIVVYELWDRVSQRVYTLCDGCDFFLREPYSPARVGGRWYPFFLLPYQIVDGCFVAQSLVDSMEKLEEEHNEVRDQYAEHRRFCKPGYIAGADVDQKSLERFASSELGEITVLKNAAGQDVRSLITPKTYPQIDASLYDTSYIRQDIEQVTGLQDAMRSTVVKPKTATEAQIMQQGLSARVSAFRDSVEDWLTEIATYSMQVLLRTLSEEDVARIMGEPQQILDPVTQAVAVEKPYDWPSLSTEEVARIISVKISAGSTGAPDKLTDQESWQKILPTLSQLVSQLYQIKAQGLDSKPVETLITETVHRLDDRFDASLLIPQIQPAAQQSTGAVSGSVPTMSNDGNTQQQGQEGQI